jgi:hypothetical protein
VRLQYEIKLTVRLLFALKYVAKALKALLFTLTLIFSNLGRSEIITEFKVSICENPKSKL